MAAYDVTLDYRTLNARSDALAAGLAAHGIGRGVRAVVMVRPSPEFFLLMFALFKNGAVPVLSTPASTSARSNSAWKRPSRRPSSASAWPTWRGWCCAGARG